MSVQNFTAAFTYAEHVYIDDDTSIIGRVTGTMFRENRCWFEVSYVHNGEPKAYWIESWRVTGA